MKVLYVPGLVVWGTEAMKEIKSVRPKNLARKRVACRCDSADSIHCRHDLRGHVSLQPFRSTRQPLQLISQILLSLFLSFSLLCLSFGFTTLLSFPIVFCVTLYLLCSVIKECGKREKGKGSVVREFDFDGAFCVLGSFFLL